MTSHPDHPSPLSFASLARRCHLDHAFLVWACALITYLLIVAALSEKDFQIVLFLRSLRNPTLAEIGRIGNLLGHGVTLVVLSLLLMGAGYLTASRHASSAGIRSLLAHGLAGLVAQIIKRIVGRPRPRYAHQDSWPWGPSLDGGFDAFPSGHSAASFSVAAVLAHYFPRYRWIWYGSAVFVAGSRVLKGSHYPSDVIVGALVGYLVGCVVTHGRSEWKATILESLAQALPWFAGSFALLWTMFQLPPDDAAAMAMLGLGGLALSGGIWLKTQEVARADRLARPRNVLPNFLVGLGLACSTASYWILFVALTGGIGWMLWRLQKDHRMSPIPHISVSSPTVTLRQETTHLNDQTTVSLSLSSGIWYLGVIGLLLILHSVHGLVPIP